MAANTGNTDQSSGPMDSVNFDEASVSKPAIDIPYKRRIDVVGKSVCRIVTNGFSGSGFLFKYVGNDSKEILGLMTNNHVISKDVFDSRNGSCKLIFESLERDFEFNFKDCKDFVTSIREEMDATFFRLPEKITKTLKDKGAVWLGDVVDASIGDQIFIVQHPVGGGKYTGEAALAYGHVGNMSGYNIYHEVNTETGSSGSPVVKFDGSLVGLHRGTQDNDCNRATNLKYILEHLLGGTTSSGGSSKSSGGGMLSRLTNYLFSKSETEPGIVDVEGTTVDGIKPVESMKAQEIPEGMDVGSKSGAAVKRRREELKNGDIKRRIRSNISKIAPTFNPKGMILNGLRTTLTAAQFNKLNDESLDHDIGRDLLFMLHSGEHPTVYEVLLRLLEGQDDCKWIVDIIYGESSTTVDGIKPVESMKAQEIPEGMDVGSKSGAAVKRRREELKNGDIKRRIRSNISKIAPTFNPKGMILNGLRTTLPAAQFNKLNDESLDHDIGRDLLFMLHSGEHPTVYEVLLRLLEGQDDCKWIVDIIYGESNDDVNERKRGIHKNYADLAPKFEPKGQVLLDLFAANIFTDAECETLENSPEGERGRDVLQLLLLKPNSEACEAFFDCLMKVGSLKWMADLIVSDKIKADVDRTENGDLTNEIIKKRVKDNFSDIVVDFDPTGHVLDWLFQENILTADMYKQLYKNTPPKDRGRVLIVHLLEGAHPTSFLKLLRILQKREHREHIIDRLTKDQNGSSARQTLTKEISGFPNELIGKRVKDNFATFVAGFDLKGLVLDGLLTANVIIPQQWEEFYKVKERDRGSKLISKMLEQRHPKAFVVLLNVMQKEEDGFQHKIKIITG